ncbi:MAG TPA: class I SAM-dependent methyltransferase [Puia sp.]|jgi:ubiquinone/menaquinone biosynthesis C-methylase UbiE|nr:class I SAM-dependent methyltransferase [Puia sp.]
MEISRNVKESYSRQYSDAMAEWRMLGGKDKATNIVELAREISFKNVLEVGSGEGSILYWLSRWNFSDDLNCVEISESGLEMTKGKNIEHLKEALLFDGYKIPFDDDHFDLVICSHVIEHVEHERLLLREIKRVSKYQIFEVPIDFSFYVDKKVKHFLSYGHINIYTPGLFRFMLQTENFIVKKDKCVLSTKESLRYTYRDNKAGLFKMKLRHFLLNLFPYLKGIKPNAYTVLTTKKNEDLSIF